MSIGTTVKIDLAKYGDPVLRALELIQSLTGLGGPAAAEALQVAGAVLHTLETGVAANLTADDILADLDKLAPGEAADDVAAQDAISKRWPAP